MKYWIFAFLVLFLAAWAGIWIAENHGYVIVATAQGTVTLSLWLALLGVLCVVIVFYGLIRLGAGFFGIPQAWRRWRETKKIKYRQHLVLSGLYHWYAGQDAIAKTRFEKAAKFIKTPGLMYLMCAKAVFNQTAERDRYLQLAEKSMGLNDPACILMRARRDIAEQAWIPACHGLETLKRKHKDSWVVLQLLVEVYLKLKNWTALLRILPDVQRLQIFSKEAFAALEEKACLGALAVANAQGAQRLIEQWQAFAKSSQQNVNLLRYFVWGLLSHQKDDMAASLIEKYLKNRWDAGLVTLYGRTHNNTQAQFNTVETWLTQYPLKAELLLCAAKLNFRAKFWGQAKEYVQASLKITPSSEGFRLLGAVYEALGNIESALACYHKEVPPGTLNESDTLQHLVLLQGG